MTIFEQTFRDLLMKTNLVAERVFLMRAPQYPATQLATPYMVFLKIGAVNAVQLMTHTGPLALVEIDYQVSIFHASQTTALAIGDSLRLMLNGMSGDYENVHIGHLFYMQETSSWEADTLLYHVLHEYRVMYNYLSPAPPPVTPTVVKNRNRRIHV